MLTPMELRVLLAIVEVGGAPEVAEALGIAESTIKTHLGRSTGKAEPPAKLIWSSSSPDFQSSRRLGFITSARGGPVRVNLAVLADRAGRQLHLRWLTKL